MPTDRHAEQAVLELYASTLIDELMADGGIDAVVAARKQLGNLIEYFYSHAELGEFADDTAYTSEQRSQVVRKVLEGSEPALISVIGVMVERGEFKRLPKVKNLFNDKIVEKLNITVVEVTARVPLDDHLREVIKKKAAAELGTDIVLDERIDENMLGGIIMNARGKRIDASMHTMLANACGVLKEN